MKLVKTRKDHQCGACGETIPKGTTAEFYSGRAPRYEWDQEKDIEKQVGIQYYNVWVHDYNCLKPEGLNKPNFENLQGQV